MSGPEKLILLEMAAALGWFVVNLHAPHDTRQAASALLILSTGPFRIAFMTRRSGGSPPYSLPIIGLLLGLGVLIGTRTALAWQGVGAVIIMLAALWLGYAIKGIKTP